MAAGEFRVCKRTAPAPAPPTPAMAATTPSPRSPPPLPTLLVQQAETGASVSVPASESDSVGLVKSALQASLAVPVEVQILLLGDSTLLADDHTLAEYSLPSSEPSDRPVFVFDRRTLSRSAKPPEPTPLLPTTIDVPEALSAAQTPRANAALDSVASPLVRALLDYERRFYLHELQAVALHDGGRARLAAARECLGAQRAQAEAVKAAVANLNSFGAQLTERYAAFQSRYAEVVPRQSELAEQFPSDLDALRAVELDEAVRRAAHRAPPAAPTANAPHPSHAPRGRRCAASRASTAPLCSTAAASVGCGSGSTSARRTPTTWSRRRRSTRSRGRTCRRGSRRRRRGLRCRARPRRGFAPPTRSRSSKRRSSTSCARTPAASRSSSTSSCRPRRTRRPVPPPPPPPPSPLPPPPPRLRRRS